MKARGSTVVNAAAWPVDRRGAARGAVVLPEWETPSGRRPSFGRDGERVRALLELDPDHRLRVVARFVHPTSWADVIFVIFQDGGGVRVQFARPAVRSAAIVERSPRALGRSPVTANGIGGKIDKTPSG